MNKDKKFYNVYKGYIIMLDYTGKAYEIRRKRKWHEKLINKFLLFNDDNDITLVKDIYDMKTAKNYIDIHL